MVSARWQQQPRLQRSLPPLPLTAHPVVAHPAEVVVAVVAVAVPWVRRLASGALHAWTTTCSSNSSSGSPRLAAAVGAAPPLAALAIRSTALRCG